MRKLSYLLALSLLIVVAVSGMLSADDQFNEPVLEIVAPPNDSTISGSEVEIAVQFAVPKKQPVTSVQVFLDGKYITQRAYESGLLEGYSSFKWDTTRAANGRHKLDFHIFSGEQSLGMTSSDVYVSNRPTDIIPPRVAVTSPREGAVVSGITSIVIAAADESGREPMVNIFVDKDLRSVKNRSPYEYLWDTTVYPNGPHTIEIGAEDDSRNTSPMKTVHVIIRNSVAQQPMVEASANNIPAVPSTSAYAATPAETATSSSGKEVARVAQPQPAGFEVKPATVTKATNPAPKPVAAPKPAVRTAQAPSVNFAPRPAAVPATKPTLTLMAKADTKPLLIAQCCTTPGAQTCEPVLQSQGESAPVEKCANYTVRDGDSLGALSRKFGVSVMAIAKSSNIEDPTKLQIGQKLRIPSAPRMIPVRPVFEASGGNLMWESGKKAVHAVCPQTDVLIKIGSARAVVNKKPVMMDRAAVVNSGRTMVPESFVTGPLGMTVPGK